jgi:hypothetical protein
MFIHKKYILIFQKMGLIKEQVLIINKIYHKNKGFEKVENEKNYLSS